MMAPSPKRFVRLANVVSSAFWRPSIAIVILLYDKPTIQSKPV
jgi:hypothetical protein